MLRGYRRAWLRDDLAAGLSVAAVALPTAIAYAQLAGFPPVVGLYASILPLVVYAVFGTSRQLIVNPDAATCAMVAAIVTPLATGPAGIDASLYTTLAVTLAVFSGVACIVAGMFRLGFLADFLGKPVLVGFMNGIAISIVLGQIGKVFGFSLASGRILPRLFEFASKLEETHWPTLAVGAITFAVVRLVKRFLPRLPAPLLALIVAVALVQRVGPRRAWRSGARRRARGTAVGRLDPAACLALRRARLGRGRPRARELHERHGDRAQLRRPQQVRDRRRP